MAQSSQAINLCINPQGLIPAPSTAALSSQVGRLLADSSSLSPTYRRRLQAYSLGAPKHPCVTPGLKRYSLQEMPLFVRMERQFQKVQEVEE